jgi:hypothetical protein
MDSSANKLQQFYLLIRLNVNQSESWRKGLVCTPSPTFMVRATFGIKSSMELLHANIVNPRIDGLIPNITPKATKSTTSSLPMKTTDQRSYLCLDRSPWAAQNWSARPRWGPRVEPSPPHEVSDVELWDHPDEPGPRWWLIGWHRQAPDGHGALGAGGNGAHCIFECVGVVDFTLVSEQQRPPDVCRLVDAQKPNASTIDWEEGNRWTGTWGRWRVADRVYETSIRLPLWYKFINTQQNNG